MIGWLLVSYELSLWRRAGHKPRLWWRDDDATDTTEDLSRLIALAETYNAPLMLAVVPEGEPRDGLERLGTFLEKHPQVFVAQHGLHHQNRGRTGEASAEFCSWESADEIASAIKAGQARLASLPRQLPAFVPPWNIVHPALRAALDQLGLVVCADPHCDAFAINAHVDLMRWKPAPQFRGKRRILSRLRRHLRARRRVGAWDKPIGLLTHHLAHDEGVWHFLEEMLRRTTRDPRVVWTSPAELFKPDL